MAKQVLVVGAGIVGASIAWHLAKAGCRVTVIDAGDGGGLATAHSFAWINATWGNPERYFHFRRRSMAGWRRLEQEAPGVSVDWCGGLIWDMPADQLEAYAEEHGRWGYGLRRVGRDEALHIEPNLVSPPGLALHIAEEGMVEPVAAARALLADAVASGALLVAATRIRELLERGGKIAGAVAEDGTILEAEETVVAAGVGTARLLATVGARLRMDTPPGLIMHSTVADRRLLNGMVMAPDLHLRQTREGRLIAGADFAGADPKGRENEMARDLLGKLKAALRGTETLEVDFFTVGHRPTPADGFPAIGRVGGFEGLYVTVLHSGVTLAPIVGELAAREIAEGERDGDLEPYDPGRAELV
ncbi:FAD-binding oxidoreductase [Mesorhizobium sp. LHD-90]|uniref:NAD(P)/FAD-dependent oxidoreductase n=1 Tax=Mesorhizobium sp. LHD-90 TaxID=3071414 RepID=UPI0027E1070B|nr:FAD-binding oxidoreductase [Mesorhizobium sp. LHD-90]MDQ6433122.1 FAD-binding oxidoreductase [Mesorhizobium sp. LHD-90]